MADPLHTHICPKCFIGWDHEDSNCELEEESYCEDCLVEEIYWEEETFTTLGFRPPGSADREPTPMERQLMYIAGFKSIGEMDQFYGAQAARAFEKATTSRELGGDDPRYSLSAEEAGREADGSLEDPKGSVEFLVDLNEFNKAVKYLLAGRSRAREARLDLVDLNARASQVELVIAGASSAFPAEVQSSGYARLPLPVFERISQAMRTLREDSIQVSIETGTIRVAKLQFSHPEISLRLIGARIADLPIDAPLPDVLALLTRFGPEEVEDSGLLARVLAAQEQASVLIDRAMKILEPLEIKRKALNQFLWEQIKGRFERKE